MTTDEKSTPDKAPLPAKKFKIPFKYKALFFLVTLLLIVGSVFYFFPRWASWVMSYKKECNVVRIESYDDNTKFSLICEDGSICRSTDTGFSAVKAGDWIKFRGFPDYRTVEAAGKCINGQILKIKPGVAKHLIQPEPEPATPPKEEEPQPEEKPTPEPTPTPEPKPEDAPNQPPQ